MIVFTMRKTVAMCACSSMPLVIVGFGAVPFEQRAYSRDVDVDL